MIRFFLFTCLFLVVALPSLSYADNLSEYPQNYQHLNGMPDYTLCREDADCTLVAPQPPCECGDEAVNKHFLDEYYDSFKEQDPNQYCELCPDIVAQESRRAVCTSYMCAAIFDVIEWRRCEVPADCMLVPNWGVCGCGQKAINKDMLPEFDAYRDEYHQSPQYLNKVRCKPCQSGDLDYVPDCARNECVAFISR